MEKYAGTTVDEKTKITITVNKIEAIKTGVINLNLKSLLGSKATIEQDENGIEINPTVGLKITVNDEVVYSSTHRKDETSITANVSGKGTVTIKILVDDVRIDMRQFDLSVENPVLTID